MRIFSCTKSWNSFCSVITACKRSLRRLCFFTCLSVHRGVCSQGVCSLGGGCLLQGGGCGDPPVTATAAGCTHPTGMHSCCKSVLISSAEEKSSIDFTISGIVVYLERKRSSGLLFLSWFKFEFTFSHKLWFGGTCYISCWQMCSFFQCGAVRIRSVYCGTEKYECIGHLGLYCLLRGHRNPTAVK